MVTIRDVAKHASVSPATASLVLRDASRVRPRLRSRVEAAIRELGYQPRPVGRPRRSRRMFNIATVYPGVALHDNGGHKAPTSWWFNAIRQELGRRGHHLSIFGGQRHVDQDPIFQQIVSQGEIDGAVIVGAAKDGYLEWLRQRDIPLVVINREPTHNEFSHVSLDNYGAGRQVAEFFVSRGHRRLAMIRAPEKVTYSEKRWAGFRDASEGHGLKPSAYEGTVRDGSLHCEAFCRAILNEGVTAVFCVGDGTARQCIDAWVEMGVSIPRDLSVVGFDDTGRIARCGLRPSSVGFDSDAVGQAAASQILTLIENRDRFQSLAAFIRTELVEHDTTGECMASASSKDLRRSASDRGH